jgi:CDP-diacylglycerol--glycerol-3-phosphate 3-phosphatidyltransferase
MFPDFADTNYQKAKKIYPTDRIIQKTILWMIPDFITPNQVTAIRLILTPFVIYFLLSGNFKIGVPLFLITALTDAIDGALARTRDRITNWGKLFDPVADKVLIISTILILAFHNLNTIIAAFVVAIEVIIIIAALIWRKSGKDVQANLWGKIKMVLEVSGVFLLLFASWFDLPIFDFASALLAASGFFAIISVLRHGI